MIAIDNTTSSNAQSGTTLTLAHTCNGLDRVLAVGIQYLDNGGGATTTVTYNGVAMTLGSRSSHNIGEDYNEYNEVWYLFNPASGSNNIVATTSGNYQASIMGGTSFTGCDTSSIDGSATTGPIFGFGTAGTLNINTSFANTIVFATTFCQNVASPAMTDGQTNQWNLSAISYCEGAGSTKTTTSPGTVNITYTYPVGTQRNAIEAIGIKEKPSLVNSNPGAFIWFQK